jgi:O-Antigen ligase
VPVLSTDADSVLKAAALCVAALTAWRPLWALLVLMAALPWATHHPAAPQSFALTVLLATFQATYLLRERPSLLRAWRGVAAEPVLLAAALFVAAAALSLSSLPLLEFWRTRAAGMSADAPTPWLVQLAQFLRSTEGAAEYPVKAVLLTLQAFLLALIVRREAGRSCGRGVSIAVALVGGTAVFITAGILETFGVLDLSWPRGTEFSAYREGTVQAASGNPGWFSQYASYVLPYSIALIALGLPAALRVALLVVIVALHGIGLAAAFQRGGWLTGAVLMGYVAVFAPKVLRRGLEPQSSTRARVAWTASLAVVATALVAGGAWLWIGSAGPGRLRPPLVAFAERFWSITQGDRIVYQRVAFEMATLHPVLGAGHESFATRYFMYYLDPAGALAASPNRVPDPAADHSVYGQTLTGTGLVGLATLLAVFVAAAAAVRRVLRDPHGGSHGAARVAVATAGGGSLLAIAIYGLVQEVFYVHALRVLFFVGVGLVAGAASTAGTRSRVGRMSRPAIAALAVAFVVHLGYEYVWPGPDRLFATAGASGLGGEERGSAGETYRWATIVATWPVSQGAAGFSARVRSVAPFPQTVTLTACGRTVAPTTLADQSWRGVEASLIGCRPGQRVYLRTSPGWRPGGTGGWLGVMVSDVRQQ